MINMAKTTPRKTVRIVPDERVRGQDAGRVAINDKGEKYLAPKAIPISLPTVKGWWPNPDLTKPPDAE